MNYEKAWNILKSTLYGERKTLLDNYSESISKGTSIGGYISKSDEIDFVISTMTNIESELG